MIPLLHCVTTKATLAAFMSSSRSEVDPLFMMANCAERLESTDESKSATDSMDPKCVALT